MLKRIEPQIWVLLALSVFAWGPLLNPAYFFQAHDAQHSIFYLVEFDQTFRDGYLWPRWSPDFAFGYGYPLFNIYAPLAIYMAELVHLLGATKVVAVKTVYILATIGSGLSMYGFARRLFGKKAGFLAGVVYMYAPFHLLEIYVRSAFAEYVALALLPLALWAFAELIAQPDFRRLCLAGGSYGLLALTHHTTFFTFTPFLMLYIMVLVAGKAKLNFSRWFKLGLANVGAGILGLALAGIYLLPVIFERQYIKVEQWVSGSYNAFEHFVYFSQLFSPKWDYGYSGPGPVDGMSYQIGIVIYGLLIFTLVGLAVYGQDVPHRGTIIIFLGAGLVSIWLMSPLAAQAWKILPITALIQFPWRLLIITMLSFSVIIGALAPIFRIQATMLNLVALVVVVGSYSYTQPQYTPIPDWAESPLAVIEWDAFSPSDRVGMVVYTEEQPGTSPMEAQYRDGEPLDVATVLSGQAEVHTLRHGGASDEVQVSGGPATIQFYTYDYPGWRVFLNGEVIPHRHETPFGLITVDVPAGNHSLLLKMGTTPVRMAGGLLSLLALGILGFGVFFQKQITKRNKSDSDNLQLNQV